MDPRSRQVGTMSHLSAYHVGVNTKPCLVSETFLEMEACLSTLPCFLTQGREKVQSFIG